MNGRLVSNFAKYYPISIVFDFMLNYWQCKTFTSKQRRASAIPAACYILAPPLAKDANGKDPERNRRECRQREDRKGERNGRQGEGTRNVKRCIAWEAGNGRQREEM